MMLLVLEPKVRAGLFDSDAYIAEWNPLMSERLIDLMVQAMKTLLQMLDIGRSTGWTFECYYSLTNINRLKRPDWDWMSAAAVRQPSARTAKNLAWDHCGHMALTSPPSQ